MIWFAVAAVCALAGAACALRAGWNYLDRIFNACPDRQACSDTSHHHRESELDTRSAVPTSPWRRAPRTTFAKFHRRLRREQQLSPFRRFR